LKRDQRFEPSGFFARHGREVLGPSDDGGLVAARASGEVALGPFEDGKADQQPIAGHGDCGCCRFYLSHLAFVHPLPGVFKLNTSAALRWMRRWATGFRHWSCVGPGDEVFGDCDACDAVPGSDGAA